MEIRVSGNRVMRKLGDPRMVLFDCLLHIRLCFHFCIIVLFVHISHTFIKYKQQKFEIQIPLPMSVALDAEHQRSSTYVGRYGILIFSCLLFVLFEKMCSIKSCHFSKSRNPD